MVIVHEFGHFALAKLFRVRVEAFSFGFWTAPLRLQVWRDRLQGLLLPLGGYVKMTGETPDQVSGSTPGTPVVGQIVERIPGQEALSETPDGDPGSFTTHPRWQRILIGLAGPEPTSCWLSSS